MPDTLKSSSILPSSSKFTFASKEIFPLFIALSIRYNCGLSLFNLNNLTKFFTSFFSVSKSKLLIPNSSLKKERILYVVEIFFNLTSFFSKNTLGFFVSRFNDKSNGFSNNFISAKLAFIFG